MQTSSGTKLCGQKSPIVFLIPLLRRQPLLALLVSYMARLHICSRCGKGQSFYLSVEVNALRRVECICNLLAHKSMHSQVQPTHESNAGE